MTERNVGRKYKTFDRERREPKPISDGAWESVLVALKTEIPLLPNETIGVGDSDFWIEIEDRASMTPQEACMQFKIHNIGHRTLADFVVFSFQAVRSAWGIGGMEKGEKRLLTDRVANKLLELYPPRYRAKFGK